MDNENRFFTTLDAYQAGFLTLKGHTPELTKSSQKIIFNFQQTDKLATDLGEYFNGAMVDAMRFALAVKQLKTQIFSKKEEEKHGQRNYNL